MRHDGHRWLKIYLQDHYAGASAGVSLFGRAATSHRDPAARKEIGELAHEVARDRDALLQIMHRLEIRPNRAKAITGLLAERLGRLKTNGRLLRRSPLSDVIDTEALALGVRGKAHGWKSLLEAVEDDPRLDADELHTLLRRATEQEERLDHLHVASARSVFS
jgi:hypothetical protein